MEESPFDDIYTLRRKWAYRLKTHFDTLILLDDSFVNLEDVDNGYYAKYYNDTTVFSEMATNILQEFKYIFVLDIIMSFIKYVGIENIEDWDYMFEEFYKVDNNRKYQSDREFKDYYNVWNRERDQALRFNEVYVDIIEHTQADMLALEEEAKRGNYYITSKFKHRNVSLVIKPTLKSGIPITYRDGIDIFDNIVVSENVPFVKYNNEVKSYYKVYKGDTIHDIPNYANIDIPEEDSNDINIIYLKLWTKTNTQMGTAAKKDYIKVVYYLKFNKIMLTLPEVKRNIDESEAYNILSNTFSNLDLSDRQRVDIKGSFNIFSFEETGEGPKIYPLSFDEFAILDIITRYINGYHAGLKGEKHSYLMGSYFFLDEVEHIFSTKVAMKLHFRSLTSGLDLGNKLRKDFRLPSISKANVELVNNTTTFVEDYDIIELEQEFEVPAGTEYIQVNVNAKDEDELDQLLRILKIALYSYNIIERKHIPDEGEIIETYNKLGTKVPYVHNAYDLTDLSDEVSIERNKQNLKIRINSNEEDIQRVIAIVLNVYNEDISEKDIYLRFVKGVMSKEKYSIDDIDYVTKNVDEEGVTIIEFSTSDSEEAVLVLNLIEMALYAYNEVERKSNSKEGRMAEYNRIAKDIPHERKEYNLSEMRDLISIKRKKNNLKIIINTSNDEELARIERAIAVILDSYANYFDILDIYTSFVQGMMSRDEFPLGNATREIDEEGNVTIELTASDRGEAITILRLIEMALYVYNKAERRLRGGEITDDYVKALGWKFVNSLKMYQKWYKNILPIDHEESNSRKLKRLDRDIFVSSYPTICRNIPLAIDESEIEEWKSKKVKESKIDGSVVEKERQVISYPKDDPKYHFVCEDPAPYIGMIKNTLSNRAQYSHLPCCYLVDQQIPGEATKFNEYYRDIKTGPKGAKSKGLVKGKFILLPERYGNVPTQLNDILGLYTEKPTKFFRYGVPSSVNSLIHCVCKALSIQMYLDKENNPDELEDYVVKIRSVLARMPNVYRQELYDLSEEEIVTALNDGNIFLDPSLFYRGIEELFGVNIFTFTPSVDSANIEVPRKWLFHVSTSRSERSTILIYKHYGSNRDTRDYPQCELIVESTKAGFVGTYDKDMYKICRKILGDTANAVIWTALLNNPDKIEGNKDIYSSVNYNKIIQYSAYEQYIDKYGKCRGFNFRVSDDEKVYDLTMMTPPTQPEDLPLSTTTHRANYNLAIDLFGKFTKIDKEENKVIGLWFKVFDVEEGIYVPIIPIDAKSLKNEEIGDGNPIIQNEKDKAQRYSNLKRNVTIFLELLKWLYEIYKLENNIPDGNVDAFVETYYMQDEFTGDSLTYYDFSKVPYRLPRYNNMKDAINYLQDLKTGMIEEDSIVLYNEKFSQQAYEYIRRYNQYTEGLEGNPQAFIAGYFQNTIDYKSDPHTVVFEGSKSYREWLERMVYGPFRMFNIDSGTISEKILISTPYIIYENGKYIMIQNVLAGDYNRAITVSLNWIKNKINDGYNVMPLSNEEIEKEANVEIYTVTLQNTLMLVDRAEKEEDQTTVYIMRYGNSSRPNDLDSEGKRIVITRYAAMLPLN